MSLQDDGPGTIPAETVRVAQGAFPKGSVAMRMRDLLGGFVRDHDLERVYALRGRPVEAPWRMALVTVLQFMEGLSDRQAADAVRSRIDWKYALSLELTDPGFDYSVLSEFRTRLIEQGDGEERAFVDRLLQEARWRGWLKERGQQRSDTTHVLAAIRTLNRLALAGEAVRAALNSLAVAAPVWLRARVPEDWHDRYDHRVEEYRLPAAKAARAALAEQIGADGGRLLRAVYAPDAPLWLREVPAVQALRAIWVQQYYTPEEDGRVRWRTEEDWPPPARLIQSPYDTQARYSTKRETHWVGYKVCLTETCDPGAPRLITNVLTMPATTADVTLLEPIHRSLAERGQLPSLHLVDAGFVDAEQVVTSDQKQGVTVVGPVPADHSWQARAAAGFAVASFVIDWAARQATCPAGQTSVTWQPPHDQRGHGIINIAFARATCAACPLRPSCTRSAAGPRWLTVRPQAEHEALQAARRTQDTDAFKEQYAARAGIEGTISQGTRACDLRRARYTGFAKTHLQQVFTAAAINVTRLIAWANETPLAATRTSPFARLQIAA